MSLLAPLGLLGLIGIGVLILIYIIKPNYENKFVSSTYVWKLSLKYRKKKIPISKLRNILIFICQLAIITAAAFILAQPFIDNSKDVENGDTIIILDTSPSMHTEANGKTRLERAAKKALSDAEDAFKNGNKVTVILASDEASFITQQVEATQAEMVYEALEKISSKPKEHFSYCSPDVEGAMTLAEQITSYTDKVSVTLYTDTHYYSKGDVEVYRVSDASEWNAAVLDVRSTIVENHYRIEIDVASYGKEALLEVGLEISKYNGTDSTYKITADAYCSNDEVTTVVLGYKTKDMDEVEASLIDENLELFSYETIAVSVTAEDSLEYDNQFYLYGGKKPVLDVLYSSSMPNNFFPAALLVLQDIVKDEWDVQIHEAAKGEQIIQGYDLYIYEHTIPKTLPDDGVVLCVNPLSMPSSTGIKLGNLAGAQNGVYMTAGDDHPLMNNIDASKISVTQFVTIANYGEFEPLMTVKDRKGTYPTLLVKDDVDAKIVVMPFSLHFSNLAVLPEFPLLLKNMVNHFFPTTVNEFVYDTGDTIELDAMASSLDVSGAEVTDAVSKLPVETLVELPGKIIVNKHGTVTLTQYLISGEPQIESVYVKIPSSESNILLEEEKLVNPYFYSDSDSMDIDLLFYFALAMVAFLFLEWWLKSREQV